VIVIAVLIAVGAGRVISVYEVFNQTVDEGIHLGAGLEWLESGRYTIDVNNPPLPRIGAAILPYLDGVTAKGIGFHQAREIFFHSGNYFRTLFRARLGELPFFFLAAIIVARWAWRLHGSWVAVLAVGLFTSTPVVLGHAALATTDIAPTAFFITSLYTLCLWFERASIRRSLLLGVSFGLAVVSKFTVLAFFPPTIAAILVCAYWSRKPAPITLWETIRRRFLPLLLALAVSLLVIWAVYLFHVDRLPQDASEIKNLPLGLSSLADVRLPAPELLHGLARIWTLNREGHPSFFFGEIRTFGWWYFFPVVFAMKTTIAFLVLVMTAAYLLFRRRSAGYEQAVPLIGAACVLLAAMTSTVDSGVRYVLPIYPLLAIPAGFAAAVLLRSSQVWLRRAAYILLIWHLAAGIAAHPDYFPYFNELVRRPHLVRSDSDLDWGQDLARLGRRLKDRQIDGAISIAHSSIAEHKWFGIQANRITGEEETTGWVAVTAGVIGHAEAFRRAGAKQSLVWDHREPVERIGSIFLYYVPSN
jgi:4-amino-4-deoxy-L-arabinose transferase-like glycosyltransferase